jgi:DNA-binding NarL/FixJ family response regulator
MFKQLTPREMEVFRLMWDGLNGKQIGAKLKISIKTVEFHKGSMKRKLGGGNWMVAYREALNEGVIQI